MDDALKISAEIRQWLQLVFTVGGGILAFVVFSQNIRQRRVENSLRFIENFRRSLEAEDISHWKNLFYLAGEPGGAPPGYYASGDGPYLPISDYFSEGSPDGYAVSRMAESLNVMCHQVLTERADARTVYYELGQILNSMHSWLGAIPMPPGKTLLDSFPNIRDYFERYESKIRSWPSRVFTYVE